MYAVHAFIPTSRISGDMKLLVATITSGPIPVEGRNRKAPGQFLSVPDLVYIRTFSEIAGRVLADWYPSPFSDKGETRFSIFQGEYRGDDRSQVAEPIQQLLKQVAVKCVP